MGREERLEPYPAEGGVNIEDLLPRDKIEIDLRLRKQLTGKRILITGAPEYR